MTIGDLIKSYFDKQKQSAEQFKQYRQTPEGMARQAQINTSPVTQALSQLSQNQNVPEPIRNLIKNPIQAPNNLAGKVLETLNPGAIPLLNMAKSALSGDIEGYNKTQELGKKGMLSDAERSFLDKYVKDQQMGLAMGATGGVNSIRDIGAADDAVKALAQEAKKYKSAEEFVKQFTPTFRGQNKGADIRSYGQGGKLGDFSYQSFDKEYASNFVGDKPELLELFSKIDKPLDLRLSEGKRLSRDSAEKILRENGVDVSLSSTSGGNPTMPMWEWVRQNTNKIADSSRKAGYDSVLLFENYRSGGPLKDSVLVLNPELSKTKSQLTDIWNKAQKFKDPVKMVPVPRDRTLSIDEMVQMAKDINNKPANNAGNTYRTTNTDPSSKVMDKENVKRLVDEVSKKTQKPKSEMPDIYGQIYSGNFK